MFSDDLEFKVSIIKDFNFQVLTSDTIYFPIFIIPREVNFEVSFTNDDFVFFSLESEE